MDRYDYDHGYQRRPDSSPRGYFRELAPDADRFYGDRRSMPRPHRVTAPYNEDYLRPVADPPLFNPNRFGGDQRSRIQDAGGYRYPYITRAGTWTHRGARWRYDQDFGYGPRYGGRYPDEL